MLCERCELQSAPTSEATKLPFKRGGFASLCEALDYAARGDTGLNFFDVRGRLVSSLTYHDLQNRAQSFARRLPVWASRAASDWC